MEQQQQQQPRRGSPHPGSGSSSPEAEAPLGLDPGQPALVDLQLPGGRELTLWALPAAIAECGYIAAEVVARGEYLQAGISLQPGDSLVDVGAHWGLFGAAALAQQPRLAAYLAAEPARPSFALLRRNLLGPGGDGAAGSVFHLNPGLRRAAELLEQQPSYAAKLTLLNVAVSGSQAGPAGGAASTRALTYYPRLPGNATLRPGEKLALQGSLLPPELLAGAQALQVPLVSLDQLLGQAGLAGREVGLLKVDVEGEELELLRGIAEATWPRIRQLAAEVHDWPEQQQEEQQQQQPAAGAAAGLQHLDAVVDGHWVWLLPQQQAPATAGAVEPMQHRQAAQPRAGGRVLAVAGLLRARGFRVAIRCPVLEPRSAFCVYARRPAEGAAAELPASAQVSQDG